MGLTTPPQRTNTGLAGFLALTWPETSHRNGRKAPPKRPTYMRSQTIVNHKKIQRLWREEGLRVPQRRRRKRHGSSTAPPTVTADAPNRVWAVDFQFDVTTDGRPIKIVSIIDEHTRECLGGMVERSITGDHLTVELDRLAAERGTYPAVLRCDNGPELACNAMGLFRLDGGVLA